MEKDGHTNDCTNKAALAATANRSMPSSPNTRVTPPDREEAFAENAFRQRSADFPSHSSDRTRIPKNLNGLLHSRYLLSSCLMRPQALWHPQVRTANLAARHTVVCQKTVFLSTKLRKKAGSSVWTCLRSMHRSQSRLQAFLWWNRRLKPLLRNKLALTAVGFFRSLLHEHAGLPADARDN
jgi:hypothetical protein